MSAPSDRVKTRTREWNEAARATVGVSGDPLWPLFDRFPALAELPRVALRAGPTPITPVATISPSLWIKRDDLTALPIGGNKIRSLEFLLGGVKRGDRIVTAGARGSTHALTTAIHARALGARTSVAWWPQEMNDVALEVAARLDEETDRRRFANAPLAVAWLEWRRWRGDHVIPAGGTSPLGILGHVNAAFELAGQIRAGLLPEPKRVVVPLGTGGTAAGLLLGFALVGVPTSIVAARVVPRIVGRKSRVERLARSALYLLETLTRERIPVRWGDLTVVQSVYGEAYGRPLAAANASSEALARLGVPVDPTYSGKALVAAIDSAREAETLFWLTFDSRFLAASHRDQ